MELKERIDADIKSAMLARDKDRLEALRAIKSALMLEMTKGGAASTVDEATGIQLLQRLKKQRDESAAIYREQQREDLFKVEEFQAGIIAEYLPKQMSVEELKQTLSGLIQELGASGMKDMGRVMGEAGKRLAGKADGSAIAAQVKALLGAG